MLPRLRSFLTAWIRRRPFEEALDEELRFHLASYTDDLVRRGVAPAEAARRARLRFGSVERAKDGSRRARGLGVVDALERELRLAARRLWMDRRHALAAASVLALAIGVTTAVFTVANAVLWRGLPVDDDRIVSLATRVATGREAGLSLADFAEWQDGAAGFDAMAAYASAGVNVSDDVQPPALVPAPYISASVFRILGVEPALGRTFTHTEEQPGAAGTVVLGFELWQSRYGGDPGIVGRTIRIDSRPAVVIGVMPEGFAFPLIADLWLPLGFRDGSALPRDARRHRAVGRLADGVTVDEARAELEAIAGRLAEEHPETNAGVQPIVRSFSGSSVAPQRGLLLTLLAAVVLVLLIACANVGGLLLSGSARRFGDVALRTALGASRGQILRQVLVESTLLAAVGCVLGGAVAVVAVRFIADQVVRCQLGCMPYWIEWTPDGRVLAFLGLTGLAAGVLCGLAPALHACRRTPRDVLRQTVRIGEGSRAARRWTNGLLVAEVALTLVLLTGTGVAVRSFVVLYEATRIVDGDGLIAFGLRVGASDSLPERAALLQAIEDRLAATPELSASTLSLVPPFGGGLESALEIAGRPSDDPLPRVTYLTIGDDYFATLGLRLLAGMPFGPRDGKPGRERAIVNRDFVAAFLPDGEPLGRRLRLHGPGPPDDPTPWLTIAGVSPSVPQRLHSLDAEPVVYVPLRGDPGYGVTAIVRPRGAGAPVLDRIREELAQVDEDLALFSPASLAEAMAASRRMERAFMTVLGLFAAVALVLAAVGVYSATAYAVAQRTQEIGLRMALGAPRARVVRRFVRRTMTPVAVGLACGLAASAISGSVLDGMLIGASAMDRLTLLACATLVVAIALVVCVVSARHATRVDPASLLRSA